MREEKRYQVSLGREAIGGAMRHELLSVKDFLDTIAPAIPSVFKRFVSKYDWENAYDYVAVNDFSTIFPDHSERFEATVMHEIKSKWIRVTKLREKERVKFYEVLKKQKDKNWRNVYV